MRQRVVVRSITAMGIGGAMALVGPAHAAGAVGPTIEVRTPGRLIANGAAVIVPVKASCEPTEGERPPAFS